MILKGARAIAETAQSEDRQAFDGHIQGNDKWLCNLVKPNRTDLAAYFGSHR